METKKEKFFDKKTVLFLAISFAVLLCLELCFANRAYLAVKTGGYVTVETDMEEARITGNISLKDGILHINGSGKIVIEVPDEEIVTFGIECYGKNAFCNFNTYIKDQNSSIVSRKTGSHQFRPDIGGCNVFFVDSFGKASELTIEFDSDCAGLYIEKITLNSTGEFNLNIFRFIICFFTAALAWLILRKKWYGIGYNRKSKPHTLLIVIITLFCLASALIGSVKNMGFDDYPFIRDVGSYTCYQQQCDAFIKGQLNLDIPFEADSYENLENPYDYYLRREVLGSTGNLWDTAYYEGKVYSYFGVAPVVLVYYPLYLVTGDMPRDGTVSLIFAAAATAALILALLKILEYFKIKPHLLLLLLGIPALCTSSMLYVLNVHPSMYYTAVLSGITFFALLLYFSFAAATAEEHVKRRVFLALAGVCAVFTVASRPNIFIFTIMLIPLYIEFFFLRKRSISVRLIDFTCAAIPVVIGAAAIMWYNAARFSSPFDFGATYQLTFADMSYFKLALYKLFPAMYHYFLQPVTFTGTFPFMDISSVNLGVYRNYLYIYGTAGAVNFPVVWGALGFVSVSKGDKIKRFTYLGAVFAAIIVAFADFCLAGSHIRYMGDIMFPLALVGTLVLLELSSKANEHEVFGKLAYRITAVLFIITTLVASALLFANEADNIYVLAPELFDFFAKLFR
ncbi:MAG: hypothetical protein PHW77_00185 [Eubacteriales bacterium]|nr:hypothetical protein [Eubacteriales bacterium]